jgi:hypothetical protein
VWGGFRLEGPLCDRDPSIRYDRIRSEQKIIPIGQPWESVAAYAGEHVPV